ncbi:MAG: 4-deoxy-4-formamido-L-arabinose-phosphoundecaprenol deformylase ArnD [Candidatus Methanofastidiosum methylothiophilum]|uniref:4-deoxy-4-formamido-L-arabinose-phosphoundecaprenol deformylase ArnD n=1 Tax=Candidatus Methanofastidiosum methylothiophilum TaxID=1705564 RepID=A0A150IIB8_9EURY|nr:MAG: 4-deoxy-4-formamido-L-arabinose-phosphoundecaprenol deformylase ArnD [Candidatus Methanofastidiosum methylthiophilus]KYC46548.1 MAG: 4-deoxy-4-formamido-L-arabinose-phosphoundecaprenol deformylase ArnD [Candidatus Methanofastidiosum methylthiophilus]KYC49717.1 MAG: 4-deoxy-4-formamido-L-arabinose-phosphoundecaprenol deformylase ArnD [Candidatus Methanofastidiosum methylthiophilus]
MKKIIFFCILISLLLLITSSGLFNKYEIEGTYVLFTVDTEYDFPPVLNTEKGLDEGIPILLSIFEEYNVKATFLVTGEVADNRPDILNKIYQKGHEIGSHSYHHKSIKAQTKSEIENQILLSTTAIENAVGVRPVSFRAPGHSACNDLIILLQNNGYLVEASAEKINSYPYHPDENDWLKEGNMSIMRVPVSHTPAYFYPPTTYNRSWIECFNKAVSSQLEKNPKIVVIGLHPWELVEIEAPEKYQSYTRACGNYTVQNLTSLLEYLDKQNVTYVTLEELYHILND